MNTERDIIAISTWERNEGGRHSGSTGRRRTLDDIARCYECGDDVPDEGDVVFFDGHTFCSRPCMDSWVRR